MTIEYLKRGKPEADRAEDDAKVRATVEAILKDIEARGDAAVREYSERFDKYAPASFRLTPEEIEALVAEVAPRDLEDIRFAQAQVRNFAKAQRDSMKDIEVETLPGVILGHRNIPVQSVGCYVPAGRYPLPSSLLMSALPARAADVGEVIVACARPDATTFAAALEAGVDRLFRIGGAQAVAAMAYGTGSVPRVDKIVGPGNRWVAAAKSIVSADCGIDFYAGPTEILILASNTPPAWTAADLIAQAKAEIDEVQPTEAAAELDGDDVALVDVREQSEFDERHIEGAIHVPRSYLESRFEQHVPDRSRRIILYCASGQRSALAAKTLAEDLGYEYVSSMAGGITLWRDRGLPVVTLTRGQVIVDHDRWLGAPGHGRFVAR